MSKRTHDFLAFSSHTSPASTQKILQNARLSDQGLIPRDPMKEAIGLELDMINILCVHLSLLIC
jgi:hypothetical protein